MEKKKEKDMEKKGRERKQKREKLEAYYRLETFIFRSSIDKMLKTKRIITIQSFFPMRVKMDFS